MWWGQASRRPAACSAGTGTAVMGACMRLPAGQRLVSPGLWWCAGCAGGPGVHTHSPYAGAGCAASQPCTTCWSGSTQHQPSTAKGEGLSARVQHWLSLSASSGTNHGNSCGCDPRTAASAGVVLRGVTNRMHIWHSGRFQGPEAGALPGGLCVCAHCLGLQGAGPAQHVTAATCVVLVRVGGRGRLCRPSQLLGGRGQSWLEWWSWHPRAAPLGGDTHGQWQRGVTHQTWWGGLALSAVGSPFSGDAMCLDMGQQRRYSLFRVVQFVEQPGAWLHRTPSHVPVGHCGDPHRAMTQTVIPPNLGGDMP